MCHNYVEYNVYVFSERERVILKFDNQPCPCCGKPLRAEDDVVVCPVCATPQHRECWMANGHCINENLHASGYVWSVDKPQSEPSAEKTETPPDSVICHICGSENPEGALHCGNCGALFGESEQTENGKKNCAFCGKENDNDALHCKYCGAPIGMNNPYINDNPYLAGTGIAPDELIGGIKAGDIAIYTQASSKRYLPKFKRFAKGKKLSFNFAAFFFAPYWFFYRKLHKAGIFFIALFVTATLVLSGYSTDLMKASDEYAAVMYGTDLKTATEEELAEFEKELEKASNDFVAKAKKPLLVVLGVDTVLHLICALLADRLYYKKIKDDMKLINESVHEPNMRKMMISRRGGLSPLAFALSVMGYSSLVQLLAAGAEMIMNSF